MVAGRLVARNEAVDVGSGANPQARLFDPREAQVITRTRAALARENVTSYSARSATVGSILSARRVGTTQPSMQTPSMTIP